MAHIAGHPSRRALALVETAIVLPLILLLLFGILEYGWLFLRAQQITHAARHGARIGVTADATEESVREGIGAILKRAGIGASDEPWVFPDPSLMATGDTFTVTVTIPYERVGLGMPLVPVPENLQASSSMAKEGP